MQAASGAMVLPVNLPNLIPFGTEHFRRALRCHPSSTSAQRIYIYIYKPRKHSSPIASTLLLEHLMSGSLAESCPNYLQSYKTSSGRQRNINLGFSYLAYLYWPISGNSAVDQDGNLEVGITTSGTLLRVLLGPVGFDLFHVEFQTFNKLLFSSAFLSPSLA